MELNKNTINQSMEEKVKKEKRVRRKRRKKKKTRGRKWLLAVSWFPNKHVETIMVFSHRALDLESKKHRFSLISETYLVRDITFLSFWLHKCEKWSLKRLPLRIVMNYRTAVYHKCILCVNCYYYIKIPINPIPRTFF